MIIPLTLTLLPATQQTLDLAYGSRLQKTIQRFHLPKAQIDAILEKDFKELEKKTKPTAQDVMTISCGYLAGWMYHLSPYSGKAKPQIKSWLQKEIPSLGNNVEREALCCLILTPQEHKEVRHFSRSAVTSSGVVAEAVIYDLTSNLCKNESDLALFETAKKSVAELGVHKSFNEGNEATYYFACYLVRHDYKSLKQSVDCRYKAAALDPRPGAMDLAKKRCKRFEELLKKNGY